MIKLLSIDLTNYCSKACGFCYNHSRKNGNVVWTPEEVVAFAKDCISHGVEAISLGGGEPLEYEGLFDVIDQLKQSAYVSVTTNGLPLDDNGIWDRLMNHSPDKMHISIHHPDNLLEIGRVTRQIRQLSATHIKPGVNLLVSNDKIEECRKIYQRIRATLEPSQIILVPLRYSNTPTPKQMAYITDGHPFQSASCLLGCKPPTNFASISWDKKVNLCSYAGGKQPLKRQTFAGLIEALDAIQFKSCQQT